MQPLLSLPVTAYLIYRSYSRNSLTVPGIVAAGLTALLHSAHPSALPFTLLVVFFLAGSSATKLQHDVKSRYTLSSTGSTAAVAEGREAAGQRKGDGAAPRTHVQVLANSGVASALLLLHLWREAGARDAECVPTTGSVSALVLVGVVANYAAVAADTLSSELGILAQSPPRLVTRPWVVVPRGTNGGVTAVGLGAGLLGGLVVAVASVVVMPFCGAAAGGLGPVGRVLMAGESDALYRGWSLTDKLIWILAVTFWGALGSMLDSVLGAILQASVLDRRTGKIVEAAGGVKVLISGAGKGRRHTDSGVVQAEREKENTAPRKSDGEVSRKLLVGLDWLDNNQVNFLMAAMMSLAGMGVASWYWGVPLSDLFFQLN